MSPILFLIVFVIVVILVLWLLSHFGIINAIASLLVEVRRV